jgi:hypothetical protein
MTTATAKLSYVKVSNGRGTVVQVTTSVAATTGNLFRPDGLFRPDSGQYIYNWSTTTGRRIQPVDERPHGGHTYSVRVDLGDGASHAVDHRLEVAPPHGGAKGRWTTTTESSNCDNSPVWVMTSAPGVGTFSPPSIQTVVTVILTVILGVRM